MIPMASSGPNAICVPVRTTFPSLPLPSPNERPTMQTERLLLRPLTQSDLHAYHVLRKQPEFMSESSRGQPDADISETQAGLDSLTAAPYDHFIFGFFLATTGDLIGEGGIHNVRHGATGWPELGYKLGPEFWGRGYATEAMRAVLHAWWALPREEEATGAHPDTIPLARGSSLAADDDKAVMVPLLRELVVAEIGEYNVASRRVLEKLGFEHFATWEEPDTQLHRLGQPITIAHYALPRPDVIA
ncbi:acetyltransferase domain-containing protein [Xylaria sp. CBS 124048]|nr:acetyltransferase domain-containing protein [Xylaria sp. CBS 124048]